jgi:MFS family permease
MSEGGRTTAAVARPPRWFLGLPAVLREREFRRFWVGETVSLVCDQISLIALPLVAVLSLDASPAAMGYLGAAALIPNLLFSLHAGAWVDRHGHRRLTMLAADIGRAGLIVTIPLAYFLGVLSLGQL